MIDQHINWFYLATIGIILSAVLANCSGQPSGPVIEVHDAWARPGTEMTPAAFYMTIENEGGANDRLLAGESPVCEAVELHQTVKTDDGVMAMQPVVGGLGVPAGNEISLEPGGYHFMCIGKSRAFEVGDILPLDLVFDTSGVIKVEVGVRVEE